MSILIVLIVIQVLAYLFVAFACDRLIDRDLILDILVFDCVCLIAAGIGWLLGAR